MSNDFNDFIINMKPGLIYGIIQEDDNLRLITTTSRTGRLADTADKRYLKRTLETIVQEVTDNRLAMNMIRVATDPLSSQRDLRIEIERGLVSLNRIFDASLSKYDPERATFGSCTLI